MFFRAFSSSYCCQKWNNGSVVGFLTYRCKTTHDKQCPNLYNVTSSVKATMLNAMFMGYKAFFFPFYIAAENGIMTVLVVILT